MDGVLKTVSMEYNARNKHCIAELDGKPIKTWLGKDPDSDQLFPFTFTDGSHKFSLERIEGSDGEPVM